VARIQRLLGDVLEAANSLREVLAQARDLDKPRNVILALEFLGDCDLDLGDPVASRERYREALLLARGHGKSTDLVLECLRGLGAAELACGEPQTARGLIEESVAIAREQGDSFELGTSLFVLAQVLDALGETGGELEALNESRNLASTIGDDHGHARASLALARHALAEGRRVDAMTLAAEAHRLFQRIGAEHLIEEAANVLEAISEKSPSAPVLAASVAKPRKRTAAATITSDALVPGFITVDPGLLHTLGIVKALAPRRPNILVHGESGTGKELIAQAVHSQSGRTGPFVPVNCSAFPGDLIEGELFGHARGAYTGADRERVGLFEHAHKGTLFLDEIGDMPIKAQARLLRALEGGEVRRLGENTARVVDVRVVAATHRNLMAMVHVGEFRLDLYYRLAGFVVQIPAVRERPEDARLLIDHFLAKFAQEQEKSLVLMPELREELAAHSWPGNVREIRLVMERLVSLTSDGTVLRRLPFRLEGAPRPRSLPEALEAEERRRVLDALTTHNWNKQRAANALGTSRTTLIAKMQRMGIAIKKP
jgi:transcriptional regulator with GAF, ATPase, and Fis domain